MKIQLTIELNLPDDTPLVSDAHHASLGQLLFDEYVNYATVSHMTDAVEWCAKGKVGSDNEDNGAKLIYKHHQTWGRICRDAVWSFKEVK